MIVCSCNVITSEKVKEFIQSQQTVPSVGKVLKGVGCNAVCGTCATSIRKEVIKHYGVKE